LDTLTKPDCCECQNALCILVPVFGDKFNQSINHLLAIITWGKKHREYNQYKWQVQPGRNCAYSWPWNTNKSISII